MPKTVLCETLLRTMRGIKIFQNQSYREISPKYVRKSYAGTPCKNQLINENVWEIHRIYQIFETNLY